MLKSRVIVYWGFIIILFLSCQSKRPDDLINETKMGAILYDYHIAKAMGNEIPYDKKFKKQLYVDAVFEKHHITEAEFDSSLVWYTRHPKVFKKIYSELVKRYTTKHNEVNHLIAVRENRPDTSLPGDSVELFIESSINRLTGYALDRLYTFVIPSDSNFYSQDTIIWNINCKFTGHRLPTDSLTKAVMNMQIAYAKDSVVDATQEITRSGEYSIKLFADTLGQISEVRGFVYFINHSKDSTLLLLQNKSLMRYHCRDSVALSQLDSLQSDTVSVKGVSLNKKLDKMREMPINLKMEK